MSTTRAADLARRGGGGNTGEVEWKPILRAEEEGEGEAEEEEQEEEQGEQGDRQEADCRRGAML